MSKSEPICIPSAKSIAPRPSIVQTSPIRRKLWIQSGLESHVQQSNELKHWTWVLAHPGLLDRLAGSIPRLPGFVNPSLFELHECTVNRFIKTH